MEEEFEDQLCDYVELDDLVNFDFKIYKFDMANMVWKVDGRMNDVRWKFGKAYCCLICLTKIVIVRLLFYKP